jgi:hypothetical protein
MGEHIENIWNPARRKKNPANKNQGWEPIHQNYKANYKYTQPKEKTKANNQQKSGKDLMQRGLIIMK